MVPSSVQKAIELLNRRDGNQLNRELVVAFSALSIFEHHYPSRATSEIRALIAKHEDIKIRERSRFVKQRRIALVHILRELNESSETVGAV